MRIVIPLSCIARQVHKHYANTLNLVSLFVVCPNPLPQESASPFQVDATAGSSPDLKLLQFAMMENSSSWAEMGGIIDQSRLRGDVDDAYAQARKVIVDYGSLGYHAVQKSPDGNDGEKSHDQFVCGVLGIAYTTDVWGKLPVAKISPYLTLKHPIPVAKARLHHSVVCSGYLVVSPKWIGFWSKSLTMSDQRYRIQTSTVLAAVSVEPKIRGLPVYTIQLDIQGRSSLKFQMCSERRRDEAVAKLRSVTGVTSPPPSPLRSPKSELGSPPVKRSSSLLAPITRNIDKRIHTQTGLSTELILQFPKAVNVPKDAMYPMAPMHFVCLTIGSRGDVQPFIALAIGLKSEGHRVTLVTHPEYKSWIESFGVGHRSAGGDPGMLMKLSVDNKVQRRHDTLNFAYSFSLSPDVLSPVLQRGYYECERSCPHYSEL